MNISIINGPNLNLLGTREKSIYGEKSFEDFLFLLEKDFPQAKISYFQSNVEGEIINCLHKTGFSDDGIVLNAGGYTHTSVAIADAIAAISTPVFEVHISNIYAREDYRNKSLLSKNCVGILSGLGLQGYTLALKYFLEVKDKV